ncbi:hemerythrin domain-containing protein [Psychrobacter sp. TAE2020]|uniref:hemerythrin domain-containing protein n=1 Tax=Psychrobacter sp. TAE2020 TaxID=2846762 RepID=UPI001C11A172|nr:hemerythrin domain-containing protein [Psychrobacter sp. TAE2020]MBU5615756.1 hemerythrin domain-containing protein [Psychrobacter sp. TAE2020]
MKRANQLQPLSRQHHLGLNLGRHGKECADNPQQIAEHWQALCCYMGEMHDHFKLEDDLIVKGLHPYRNTQPEVASVLDELATQHKALGKLITDIEASLQSKASLPTVAQVRQLANLLYDHLRFEERELFPISEKYLTEAELDAVYEASPDDIKHLEERR